MDMELLEQVQGRVRHTLKGLEHLPAQDRLRELGLLRVVRGALSPGCPWMSLSAGRGRAGPRLCSRHIPAMAPEPQAGAEPSNSPCTGDTTSVLNRDLRGVESPHRGYSRAPRTQSCALGAERWLRCNPLLSLPT